ncbi:MAG: type transport system ATP-binding protein [Solirubrobacteraceae bacterium]|nr:type transport system ATP-binding protein [Solirubrobacteraceae bacterium]
MGPSAEPTAARLAVEPHEADPLLILDGIVMELGRNLILDGATLDAPPGSVTCIAGANGAGKTTLLRVAAGILEPKAGTVLLGALSPQRNRGEYSRRLGFASAGNQGLYARLKVVQNLRLWAALAYVPFAERERAVTGVLEEFGLSDLATRRSDRLSLGQRQRVRLALAFLHSPDLVLLDEPHTSLDEDGMEGLANAMAGVAARGGAVLWAAPSAEHAPLPANRVARIDNGQVVL